MSARSDPQATWILRAGVDCSALPGEDCARATLACAPRGVVAVTVTRDGYGADTLRALAGVSLRRLAEWEARDTTGATVEDYYWIAEADDPEGKAPAPTVLAAGVDLLGRLRLPPGGIASGDPERGPLTLWDFARVWAVLTPYAGELNRATYCAALGRAARVERLSDRPFDRMIQRLKRGGLVRLSDHLRVWVRT